VSTKIHHVTDNAGGVHIVRSHTKAGARRFVEHKIGSGLLVKVSTQDELLTARDAGTPIEDATTKEPTP
jgi:hypothetical protein